MKIFKDAMGRDWTIEINLATREVVKAKTDVDFLDVGCIEKLADLATLGSVLYALCEDEITKRNIDAKGFATALKGDAFDHAREAIESELCDFFPSGRRPILTKALAKAKSLERIALEEADKAIDDPEMEKALRKMLKNRSGSLLESLGFQTPAT